MKIDKRYLSSKIDHNKGEWRGIPWENWEVTINFLLGKEPNIEQKTIKKECATEKEAKKLQSQALKIIRLAISDPENEFFKQRVIEIGF